MRVRIIATPKERELDGIRLDRYSPGVVRNLHATIAVWLIAQGYAVPEMRGSTTDDFDFGATVKPVSAVSHDRAHPRRRSTDR